MNPHAKHTAPPVWLSLASGTIKAVQHRKNPRAPCCGAEDGDPLGELLGEPEHVPPMVDLSAEWVAQNGADGSAFSIKRPDRIGTTPELLATLRLTATFQTHDAAYALCDPAAITVLDVGHPDWIQPASRAMQDVLPDHVLIYEAGERKKGDLLAYTLGGRAAESVILGSVGSGSGGSISTCDLAHATKIAICMETSFGFGTSGLIWSPGDRGDLITDPVLREAVRAKLNTAEATAKNVLTGHKILLIEMAKDLMRHRILEGAALQIWIDRITGDAPWDPEDPTGRRAAAEEAAMMDGTVIHLRDYQAEAPT